MNIPETYQAIVLSGYYPNFVRAMLSLEIREKQTPRPKGREVLVKMNAAPCNPSDIAFMQGSYNIKKETPVVPGFEGTGTVVAAGDSPQAAALLNKTVSCFTQREGDGTWAEYFLTDAAHCISIAPGMPQEEAAAFAINPFTAYGLFEKARLNKSTALIQNAGGSQVCNFVRSLARKSRVEVIDIVRKQKTLKELKEEGSEHVLNSSDEDFPGKLKDISHLLNATTAFDAVGGEMTGTIYNAMPDASEIIVYGGLSGQDIAGVEVMHTIFKNKIISGFNLGDYISTKGSEKFGEISEELQQMFISGEMKTRIQGKFSLKDFVPALKQYLGNMSGGKIIFTME